MKKILWSLVITVIIFFFNIWLIVPIISNIGYSSVESSYHLVTHSLLLSLIFLVIFCASLILERFNENNKKYDEN
ncbi:hypothetical protein [Romboutsia sp. Marseille-P6047]|uniref:hypothetical protein n=1 Tax=Romboutsia sp. Marseille-P6047 TaxID=2161817 RepID=UPI000F0479B7|nr:hypothetical protein [Romboutsia sp. Marseille-P6047]